LKLNVFSNISIVLLVNLLSTFQLLQSLEPGEAQVCWEYSHAF